VFAFIREHWDTITLVVSGLLNLLGGTGLVKPIVKLREPSKE
jgi:hypothetical protein